MKRFLIPIILITCNSYAAGIQKWVDETGQIHYGDTPPLKTTTESVSVSHPPSNPGKPLPRFTGSKGEEKSAKKEVSDTKKPGDKNTQEVNKPLCEKAKQNLDVIARNSLIRLKQADGTERVLSDKEVDDRRKQFENDIKQYCK